MSQSKYRNLLAKLYTIGMSCIGIVLVVFTIRTPLEFTGNATLNVLLALLLLTLLLQATAVFSDVLDDIGLGVISAISLAAAITFGISSVPLVALSAAIGFIYKRYRYSPISYLKALEIFGFNVGMWSLTAMLGGSLTAMLGGSLSGQFDETVGFILSWIFAAVVTNQSNFWLLSLVVSLHNPEETVLDAYRQNIWAMKQDLILLSVGGLLIAIALQELGMLGLAIIALPMVLSSLSFRTYVRKTQEQMEKLEDMVAERTGELQTAYNELEELNAQKGQFLAVLSHDMKTPLSAIRLYTQLMQRSPDIAVERRMHMLETILSSEKALTDMVMDIVEIERMQLGHRPTLAYKHYDFPRMLNEICATLRPAAEKKALALTVVPSSAPILMYGDEARLRRVFENLLSNAVKYTPEGGRVHVWTTHNEEQLKVFIADTGYGIPEQDLAHIFAPYHRVKENEQHAIGTGLGLAIVKGFVDMHGGTIDVTSEVGSGSQFEVTLPLHGVPTVRNEQLTILSADAVAKPPPPSSQPSLPRPRQSV